MSPSKYPELDSRTDPAITAYPTALAEVERDLWRERFKQARQGASEKESERPSVGFGLSGGGIRSATFCLGVFQALAKSALLRKIDYISSVSGGSFFASFYGRLFSRQDLAGFDDIEKILSPDEKQRLDFPADGEWKRGVFGWLRENGRYLAPSGSGDLLIGIAVFLRNWLTVQLLISINLLAILLFARLLPLLIERQYPGFKEFASGFGTCIWWSPYIFPAAFAALFGVIPLGWSYWSFSMPDPGETEADAKESLLRRYWRALVFVVRGFAVLIAFGLICIALGIEASRFDHLAEIRLAAVAIFELTYFFWLFGLFRADDGKKRPWLMPVIVAVESGFFVAVYLTRGSSWSVFITVSAAMTVVLLIVAIIFGNLTLASTSKGVVDQSEKARGLLSQWLRTVLVLTLCMLAFALIDSVGQTLFALSFTNKFSPRYWLAPLFAAITAIVPFARSATALIVPKGRGARPSISLSAIAFVGAVIVILPALVALDGLSHAVAYNFAQPGDAPSALMKPYIPSSSTNVTVALKCTGGSAGEPATCSNKPTDSAIPDTGAKAKRSLIPLVCFLAIAALFSAITGGGFSRAAWVFLNRTSLHALYCSRLIRAYLGASNKSRYGDNAGVTDPVDGDDISQGDYWHQGDQFWKRGAPLHLVNVTINETLDGRSQTEQRDRKGIGMAIGPGGLSVGVQHHVVFTAETKKNPKGRFEPVVIRPEPKHGFAVFNTEQGIDSFGGQSLSLGNWTAISGAAVSTGLGGNTTLATSLLTGFFNVRLGYWWDSGTRSIIQGCKLTREIGKWFTAALPVQASLIDEFLGRFRGTMRRYWYLTDGGHFEDLGGYELIRRRLPLIVLVDAEDDVDYNFEELANLIRKARLDFNAEISFIDKGKQPDQFKRACDEVQKRFGAIDDKVFGTLDQLRRGKWAQEPVPERSAYFKSTRTDMLSLRHAALAEVKYLDDPDVPGVPAKLSYILLIKPTLIGEEPEDILNYHSAHPNFPQETTADQFFDEAQWESYRRLGQHIAEKVFK